MILRDLWRSGWRTTSMTPPMLIIASKRADETERYFTCLWCDQRIPARPDVDHRKSCPEYPR